MSVPPPERPPADPPPDPERDEPERKSASPLVWLLLLIALIAIAWYFFSQPEPTDAPIEPATPAAETTDADVAEPIAEPVAEPATAPADTTATPDPVPADRLAEAVAQVQPTYPAAALRTREEGTVLLQVEVDVQGRAASVEIERSSRSRDLDRAAREAVSQWTFSPAIENGQPVASTVQVPVDFKLDEQ